MTEPTSVDEPTFFPTPADLRAWLKDNHDRERELWVGFHKKGSGRPSITWPQSVDEALCYGWIDGVRKGIDEQSYKIRFTPRKPTSTWSAVNVARVAELERAGRMRAAGRRAFERRSEARTGIYSHERKQPAVLPDEYEAELRANAAAWEWFNARPPGYRRTAIHWVVSAKQEQTRRRRLAQLIDDSASGRTVKPLTWPKR